MTGVEFDSAAVKNARQNLSDYPWVKFERSDVARAVSEGSLPPARLVIADPPRAGLAREAVDYLIAARAAAETPAERFAYVSCDPATLARDLALLIGGGWTLENLRAFDAFPMTHHVECVATLTRTALRRVTARRTCPRRSPGSPALGRLACRPRSSRGRGSGSAGLP